MHFYMQLMEFLHVIYICTVSLLPCNIHVHIFMGPAISTVHVYSILESIVLTNKIKLQKSNWYLKTYMYLMILVILGWRYSVFYILCSCRQTREVNQYMMLNLCASRLLKFLVINQNTSIPDWLIKTTLVSMDWQCVLPMLASYIHVMRYKYLSE